MAAPDSQTSTEADARAKSATVTATDSDLPALPATPTGLYRHHKGGAYEVLGCVRHSETLEPLVLYRALYGEGGLWVRPHAMFFEAVEVDGRMRPRFEQAPPGGPAACADPTSAAARPRRAG